MTASRADLKLPNLKWYVSQQPPTDDKRVNSLDVVSSVEQIARNDEVMIHNKVFDLPPQEKKLVIDTKGIIHLGKAIARPYLKDK